MSRLQSRVTKQINVINKQKKKMADLQFYLKHKGGDHEVDDLRAKITSQADEAIQKLQFASLESLGRGTEHEVKGQTVSVRYLSKLSVVVETCLAFSLREVLCQSYPMCPESIANTVSSSGKCLLCEICWFVKPKHSNWMKHWSYFGVMMQLAVCRTKTPWHTLGEIPFFAICYQQKAGKPFNANFSTWD